MKNQVPEENGVKSPCLGNAVLFVDANVVVDASFVEGAGRYFTGVCRGQMGCLGFRGKGHDIFLWVEGSPSWVKLGPVMYCCTTPARKRAFDGLCKCLNYTANPVCEKMMSE